MAKLSGKELIKELERLRFYADVKMHECQQAVEEGSSDADTLSLWNYYSGLFAAYDEILHRVKGEW